MSTQNAEEHIMPQIKRHVWHDDKVLTDKEKEKVFAFLRTYHNNLCGEIQWFTTEDKRRARAEEALVMCKIIENIIKQDFREVSNGYKLGQIHRFIERVRAEHTESEEDIYADTEEDLLED